MKKHKGQLTVFAFLLFGLCVALYLGGYSSPFFDSTENILGNKDSGENLQGTGVWDFFINGIKDFFTPENEGDWLELAFGVALAGVTLLAIVKGGSGAWVLISVMMLALIANIFILPINFMYQTASWGQADVLKPLLLVFMNLLLIMSLLSFMRTGETT